jgi:hypothetical protein
MNPLSRHQEKEDRATQALITAALHVRGDDMTLEQISQHLKPGVQLSPEDEAALRALGADPLAELPARSQHPAVHDSAVQEAFLALNRKKPGQGFSPKTEQELARKRQELLEKLRKRRKET